MVAVYAYYSSTGAAFARVMLANVTKIMIPASLRLHIDNCLWFVKFYKLILERDSSGRELCCENHGLIAADKIP